MAKGKTESVAEFLARGGTITMVAPGDREIAKEIVKSSSGGPVKILTMDEAELFLSEGKSRAPKPKRSSTIDLSALPEALRKKFIDRYGKGGVDGEQEER